MARQRAMSAMVHWRPPLGVPQGGPLSPLLANIALDPLDKELTKRGHAFARYADDFLIMVKGAKAAERVMASVTRFVEVGLKLVVNKVQSRSEPLSQCALLSFRIGTGGKVQWTDKSLQRFKLRLREITRRNRGQRVQAVIKELRLYVTGWMNYLTKGSRIWESLNSETSGSSGTTGNAHLAPPKSHWNRPVQPTAGRQPADKLPGGRASARQTRTPGGVGGVTAQSRHPDPIRII